MEVKITISDSAGVGGPQLAVSSVEAGANATPSASDLAAQGALAMSGINAGAAPAALAAASQSNSGSTDKGQATAQGQDISAGAAPAF
jgi:hypothetical protein